MACCASSCRRVIFSRISSSSALDLFMLAIGHVGTLLASGKEDGLDEHGGRQGMARPKLPSRAEEPVDDEKHGPWLMK